MIMMTIMMTKTLTAMTTTVTIVGNDCK
jgi:hypothetical protein